MAWVTEVYDTTSIAFTYDDKILEHESDHQLIEVYHTEACGSVMMLNGCFMVTEKDHFVYHEMMVHPVMVNLQTPKSVLVIGGGDGGTISELVKYNSLKSIVLCEIDEDVVNVGRNYFPSIAAGLGDPRVSIVYEDGAQFVKNTTHHFDAIFVDSTDPVGPGKDLFSTEFYKSVKAASDVAVFQTESPFFMSETFSSSVKDITRVFGLGTQIYLATIPTYPGSLWSFTTGNNLGQSMSTPNTNNIPPINMLSYYNASVHQAAFALPNFVARMIQE